MSLMGSCFILTACQENNPTIASADFAIVNSGALNWIPVPDGLGAKVHFPAGIMDLPHSHSADRHVTVIKGKWRAGTGLTFDPLKAKTLDAGSYIKGQLRYRFSLQIIDLRIISLIGQSMRCRAALTVN